MSADADAFREQILAYCQKNNLPPSNGQRFPLHLDGIDLLLDCVDDTGSMAMWANLGNIRDFRNEEKLLSMLLQTSFRLNPLDGIYIGLDLPSQRIMLRAQVLAVNDDGALQLDDLLAAITDMVKQIKAAIREESNKEFF